MPSSPALNVDFRPRAPALSARPSSGVAVAHLMHRRLKTRVLSQPRRPSRRPERGRGAHSGRDGTSDREAAWSVTPGGRLQLSAQLSESEHAVRLFSLCIDERFLRCIARYTIVRRHDPAKLHTLGAVNSKFVNATVQSVRLTWSRLVRPFRSYGARTYTGRRISDYAKGVRSPWRPAAPVPAPTPSVARSAICLSAPSEL